MKKLNVQRRCDCSNFFWNGYSHLKISASRQVWKSDNQASRLETKLRADTYALDFKLKCLETYLIKVVLLYLTLLAKALFTAYI